MPFMMTRASTAPTGKRPSVRLYEDGGRSGSGSRNTASHRDLSPRSAHHYRSTPDSRRSVRSSFDESDRETEATESSDEEDTDADGVFVDKEALRDRLDIRRRPNVYPQNPQPPPPEEGAARRNHRRHNSASREAGTGRSSRSRSRSRSQSQSRSQGRRRQNIIYEEDAEDPADPDLPLPAEDADSDRRSRRRTPSRPPTTSSARRSVSRHTTAAPGPRQVKRNKSMRRTDSEGEEWAGRTVSKRPSRRFGEAEAPAAFAEAPVSLRKTHAHPAAASHIDSSPSPAEDSSVLGSIVGFAPPAAEMPNRQRGCVICMDDFSSQHMVQLRCGHQMCTTCLKRKFKTAVADPQAMPPRCCTADLIPIEYVEKLFDPGFKRVWNRKFLEYTSQRRLYCPRCGEWIKPEDMYSDDDRKAARCSKCRTKVCRACSGKWHTSRECPPHEGPSWGGEPPRGDSQRCSKCRAKMTLRDGEDRMICIHCGAEACMICGAKWKMCDCPVFECEAPDSSRSEFTQNPFTMRGDRFGSMGVPARVPSVRDLRPSSRGGGMAASVGPTAMVSMRPTEEETYMRQRMQEQRDEELSRRMYAALPSGLEDDERGNVYDTGYGEPADSESDEPDDYPRLRGRRSFIEGGGMRSRAASAILPSVPQPPPPPPTPPQQQMPPMLHHQSSHQSQHQRQIQHHHHNSMPHQHQQVHQQVHQHAPPHQHQHPHLHQAPAGAFGPTPPQYDNRSSPAGDFYMAGVNRARGVGVGAGVGVRGSSRDRRLVDRFNAEYRANPGIRAKTTAPTMGMAMPGGGSNGSGGGGGGMLAPMGLATAPPMVPATAPPMTSLGALAPPPPQPPAPLPAAINGMPLMRRHAAEADIFDNPELRAARSSAPRLWYGGTEELDATEPYGFGGGSIRRRSASMREDLLQRRSMMAGLTGPDRGMGRVHEWLTYVEPGTPAPESTDSEY